MVRWCVSARARRATPCEEIGKHVSPSHFWMVGMGKRGGFSSKHCGLPDLMLKRFDEKVRQLRVPRQSSARLCPHAEASIICIGLCQRRASQNMIASEPQKVPSQNLRQPHVWQPAEARQSSLAKQQVQTCSLWGGRRQLSCGFFLVGALHALQGPSCTDCG